MKTDFDIIVIGGGINGSGIARDASGRGYSVALLEMRMICLVLLHLGLPN